MRTTIETLAARLSAEIPGLTTEIDHDIGLDAILLRARYACPCGEVSAVCLMFYEAPRFIRKDVERIKHMLREHVREEGNEPNF